MALPSMVTVSESDCTNIAPFDRASTRDSPVMRVAAASSFRVRPPPISSISVAANRTV